MSSGHLVPFFCPYCGEDSIEPFGEAAGGWVCGDCRRQFTLRSGVRPAAVTSGTAVTSGAAVTSSTAVTSSKGQS